MRLPVLTLATLLFAGCASDPIPKSYVALMPNADGSVGEVTVQGAKGTQTLNRANQVAGTDGRAATASLDSTRLQQDFGDSLKARPPTPVHYLLYFELGGTELTAESKALLPQILERSRNWPAVDMSIIGHTDTLGSAENNTRLARQRAMAILDLMRKQGLDLAALVVESHGERNPLVPTADNVDEPRNRRVEITLR